MPRLSRRRFTPSGSAYRRLPRCRATSRCGDTQGAPPFVYAGCVAAQDDTLSDARRSKAKSERLAPHLDLEIECERPLAGPARSRLPGATKGRLTPGADTA